MSHENPTEEEKQKAKELVIGVTILSLSAALVYYILKAYVWIGKWYYKPFRINLDGKSSYFNLLSKLFVTILIMFPFAHIFSFPKTNFFNFNINETMLTVVTIGLGIATYIGVYFLTSLFLKITNQIGEKFNLH